MTPMTLPDPSGTKPRIFTCLVLAICVLGAALIAARVSHWSGYWSIGAANALSATSVEVSVGKAGFRLPAAFIATPSQQDRALSRDGRFRTLRLLMTWPGLTPDRTSYGFAGKTILVELDSDTGKESLRARLEPFYRRLARGGELLGPDGLKILTLSARGASTTDLIAYDPDTPDGFIARCLKKSPAEEPVCHRAVTLSKGLELRYRFDQSLLPHWREIEPALVARIEGFRKS
ncbi:hypothetical protein [Roseibium aggregatum]|uniref:Uncharacterized protein n=1 Tax=Roseibium aggregatum TaxID=187304 RepID=A0A939J258_9HYPH|nr:hypothetical protein [Roseibium aggregatum]MBN9671068.1 hypothetical protein [Roseibium aggregatum]